jgi:branched-chain amino acid transport system permease protein
MNGVRLPQWVRLVALVAATVGASELTGLVTSRHRVVPVPVLGVSVLTSAPAVLFALALVLVHRSARIINFAQIGVALGSGIVFVTLNAMRWPYAVCVVLALVAATLASVGIDGLLLRRFAAAPRLVATVATIAAGQVVTASAYLFPIWRFDLDPSAGATQGRRGNVAAVQAITPLTRFRWRWGVQVLTGDHLAAAGVTVAAVLAVALFFQRSNRGAAIRGAAENPEKAGTIGISTGSLSTVTWTIAGLLLGLFVVLQLPMQGASLQTVGAGLGTGTLLAGLAAGVIGGMDDLATTAVAALCLSTFTQVVYFSTTNGNVVDVVVFVVLAVALLLRRGRFGRAEAAAAGGWAAAEEIRPTPAVLAGHVSVRAGRRWVLGVLVVVLLGYPFAMSPSQVVLGATFCLFGIVAVSLVVLTGWGGQISLGQFALVGVGAAVGGGLSAAGWPYPLALVVATVAGGLVAIAIGLPALRLRGLFLAVMTLAFATIASGFFLDPHRFPALTPSTLDRPKLLFVDFGDDRAFYFLSLAGLALAVFVALGLRRTRTGRVLIAMRDNERAAQALGLSLVRVRLMTFAVSGALAALAGMLLATQNRTVQAAGYGVDASVSVFLMAVIGGLGSVTGVLTGAAYLASVRLFIESPALQSLASGGGVLVILLFFPSGLGGAAYAARDAFLRRVALREKLFVPSLLGDLRALEGDDARGHLAERPDAAPLPARSYVLESDIAEAGVSQRGRGWVYG